MTLSNRGSSVLKILSMSEGKGNIKSLAKSLELAERTIRYELEKIDDYLLSRNMKPLERTFGGNIFFEEYENFTQQAENLPSESMMDTHERRNYIFFKALFKEKINLTKLCEELDISRTTIKNDVKYLREELSKNNISLRAYQEGLILEGTENDIRREQLKFLKRYSNSMFYDTSQIRTKTEKIIEEYIKSVDFKVIKSFIDNVQKKMNKVISDEAYNIIAVYLIITVLRIKKEKFLEEIGNQNFLADTEEFRCISSFKDILEKEFEIEFCHNEILQITDYFLGSHTYNFEQSYYKNWIEIEILVKKFIAAFNKNIHTDLSKDKILFKEIINHIKPTLYRIKNRIKLENSIYAEVLNSYPNIFYLTKKAIKDIENYLGVEFSDDETAFLAIYFKGAIDRNKFKEKDLKRVLVVCAHGYGTSKLLVQQLNEIYTINVVQTIPRYMLEKTLEEERVDLIISTINIENKIDIPVVKVNSVLTQEDIAVLDKYELSRQKKRFFLSEILNIIERNCVIENKEELIEDLNGYFENKLVDDTEQNDLRLSDILTEENILLNQSAETWEEAVIKGGEILLHNGYVSKKYVDSLAENIKKYGSYVVISEGIALPHSKTDNAVLKTGMSLVTLKEPVIFPGDKKVSIILSFSSFDMNEHFTALSDLNELIFGHEFFENIMKARYPKDVIRYINTRLI
ncbi:transcription antiterminator [Fusobacterium sp. SB021]|uniref:BglG family transcription antiterminator n=1 Tax=Fusobacterium sp. SB021 TaxID=2744227 RepID=UPI003CEBD307